MVAKRRKLNNANTAKGKGVQANGAPPESTPIPIAELAAASDEEKSNWQGFCEIESDPAFFNVMLKDFGVKGVKVQEVFSLDEEMLLMLPRPIYGLIFLFKYHADDSEQQVDSCPEHVWFANQTINNACATIALLNIVNNISGIELGSELESFRERTLDLAPAVRGQEVGRFQFVRAIHNSFARKVDMLNADLLLANEYDAAQKKRKRNGDDDEDDGGDGVSDDSAFHFNAFIPVENCVWKLDGLDRQPYSLGTFDHDDWLTTVIPNIAGRMAQFEEGEVSFCLLALVADPQVRYRQELAVSIQELQLIISRLELDFPGWSGFCTDDRSEHTLDRVNDYVTNGDPSCGLTAVMINNAEPTASFRDDLLAADQERLLKMRGNRFTDQEALRRSVMEETQSAAMDQEKAEAKRCEYGPMICRWIKLLAEKDLLKEIVDDVG